MDSESHGSYWTKRRKIKKRVQAHLEGISQQTANAPDELDLPAFPPSETCEYNESFSEVSQSLYSDSDENEMLSNTEIYDEVSVSEHAPHFSDPAGDSSGDESKSSLSDNESTTDSMAGFLRDWQEKHNISQVALYDLLAFLRNFHKSLPKDPRTLLKTATAYEIQSICGGSYHHFGLQLALTKLLVLYKATIDEGTVMSLQLNIDGLPIFKSSSIQFWPILCRVVSPFVSEPFVVGLYCGSGKPVNISEYLHDLVSELKVLETGGLVVEGINFPVQVKVSCFICDAPARAYVKQVKLHNGYFGCDKCTQKGEWHGKVTFPVLDAPLRTDVHFDELQQPEHHDGTSPLADTSLGMVTNFPHDFMHLVCLGVIRRLIWLWLKGPVVNCSRIGRHMVSAISDNLVKFHGFLPSDFARKCRSLCECERWKATECRQFLLYSGAVALKANLSKLMYEHFLLLFVSIYCLASPHYYLSHSRYAHELLCIFVQQFGEIYGKDMLVYNVHGLIHLSADVEKFGPLDSFSAFPFESFLDRLKKLIRKPNFPLQQVIRRLSEKVNMGVKTSRVMTMTTFRLKHYGGPMPEKFAN